MKRTSPALGGILILLPLLLQPACYSVGAKAPAGANVALAGPHESCVETKRKRVHFALAGLVPLHDSTVAASPGTRARIQSETDIVDVFLRGLGYTFTFGLYGGTQSVVVETCYGPQAGVVAGAPMPPPPPPPPPAPAPQGVTITVPQVSIGLGTTRGKRARRSATRGGASNQAYCSSSLDCGSGEFCKDRGDGMKMCMGDNAPGEYCSSSIDCGSGSFCKDPGDGMKMCMGGR
jgi:hypothetical protein